MRLSFFHITGALAMDLDTLGPTAPLLYDVQCSGVESELIECSHQIDRRTCESTAGIICQGLYSKHVQFYLMLKELSMLIYSLV